MSQEPFNLGSTIPQYDYLTVDRAGESVKLRAYVYGDRCPGKVKAKIASAHNAMVRDRQAMAHLRPDGADESWTPIDVWMDYIRDVVQTLVPDLTWEEADFVAGSPDISTCLLLRLKYWSQEALDDNPPANSGEEQTLQESVPT